MALFTRSSDNPPVQEKKNEMVQTQLFFRARSSFGFLTYDITQRQAGLDDRLPPFFLLGFSEHFLDVWLCNFVKKNQDGLLFQRRTDAVISLQLSSFL